MHSCCTGCVTYVRVLASTYSYRRTYTRRRLQRDGTQRNANAATYLGMGDSAPFDERDVSTGVSARTQLQQDGRVLTVLLLRAHRQYSSLQGQEDEADGTITSPGPGQAHATSFVRSRADGRRAPRTGACYWLLAYCYCVCARTCITHRTSWPPHVAQEAVRSSSLALS
jgi:hypothetical protein